MALKDIIIRGSDKIGLLDSYAFMRRNITKSQVGILMYHRVSKVDNWSLKPESPDNFQMQIEYLCNNYEILSLGKLVQAIEQGKPLPIKGVIFTFDDGYKDNYTYAYPILKKHRIPATIFLTTGHIGGENLFWWDKVNYVIHKTLATQISLDSLGSYSLVSELDKTYSSLMIVEKLKTLPEESKNTLIKTLLEISGIDIPHDLGEKMILSWEEIREMSNDGIDFGAHSVNHPILTKIPLTQARWEIKQSRKDIEEKLGKQITAFSYPNGNFNLELINIAKSLGFSCAVSVNPKLVSPGADLYALGRIGTNNDFAKFKVALCGLWGDLGKLTN
jgi:peptidoglycan/xylan/chitin deacetylase (PgdA/CDA1 family)